MVAAASVHHGRQWGQFIVHDGGASALGPLAPKRQRVLCARWRPPGLGRHGSRHANLVRYPCIDISAPREPA